MPEQITSNNERTNPSETHPVISEITRAEKKLGLETPVERLLEASLFIDNNFLKYALITGVSSQPERTFGDKAWAGYLDARAQIQDHGNIPLTPDFIIDLHKTLTHYENPSIGGKIRSEGMFGGAYEDPNIPVTYTEEQVAAIKENPHLLFAPEDENNPESTRGHIIYPYFGKTINIPEAIKSDLEALTTWFNEQKADQTHDPHRLAAILQRRLISLHPFEDCNGRLSRILMNWSLQSDGKPPSILQKPGDDILVDEQTWIHLVKEGSERYATYKNKGAELAEAGIDSLPAQFGLGRDKAFYDYIFQYIHQAPPLPTNGDVHKHELYENFLQSFQEEFAVFQDYTHKNSLVFSDGQPREVAQGGFISEEFRAFAQKKEVQPRELRLKEELFTDTNLYRGVMIEGELTDQKICNLFQEYTGVISGYRALGNADLDPVSQNFVDPSFIAESMDHYNQLFAATYFANKHPDIPSPYSRVAPVTNVIQDHIIGGQAIWNSPFVSTSLAYGVSRNWAEQFGAQWAQKSKHGVLFTAVAPKEGVIITSAGAKVDAVNVKGLAGEEEILIAGGLQPASIKTLEVYDRNGLYGIPGLKVEKVVANGQTKIVINDLHDEMVTKRTYAYDTTNQSFNLEAIEKTDILSQTMVKAPVSPSNNIPDSTELFELFWTKYSPSLTDTSNVNDYHKDSKWSLFPKSDSKKILEKITDSVKNNYIEKYNIDGVPYDPNEPIFLPKELEDISFQAKNEKKVSLFNYFDTLDTQNTIPPKKELDDDFTNFKQINDIPQSKESLNLEKYFKKKLKDNDNAI